MLSGTGVGAVAGAGAGDEAGTGVGSGSRDGMGKEEGARAGAGETEAGDGEKKLALRTEAMLNVGSPVGKTTT